MRSLTYAEQSIVAGGPPENPPADKGPEVQGSGNTDNDNTEFVDDLAAYILTWALTN